MANTKIISPEDVDIMKCPTAREMYTITEKINTSLSHCVIETITTAANNGTFSIVFGTRDYAQTIASSSHKLTNGDRIALRNHGYLVEKYIYWLFGCIPISDSFVYIVSWSPNDT